MPYKRFLGLIVLLYCYSNSFSQKQLIDSSALNKWPSLWSIVITNDGNYTMCLIANYPLNSSTLIIRGTQNAWHKEFLNARDYKFTSDSRFAIFFLGRDSLCIVTLGNSNVEYIADVKSFNTPKNSSTAYVAYQLSKPRGAVILKNLVSTQQNLFNDIYNYLFNDKGTLFLLQREDSSSGYRVLELHDLLNHDIKLIWKGVKASDFTFDITGRQLAFIAEDTLNNSVNRAIWYYQYEDKLAQMLLNCRSEGIDGITNIGSIRGFNYNSNRLYFSGEKIESLVSPNGNLVSLDVWNFRDAKLQSQQLMSSNSERNIKFKRKEYAFVINLNNKRIIRLEQENEIAPFFTQESFQTQSDDFLLIRKIGEGDIWHEWNWNENATIDIYLISTINGSKKVIGKKLFAMIANTYSISPLGKYVIFYKPDDKNYYSYSIASGVIKNITKGVHTIWTTYHRDDEPISHYNAIGIAGWLNDDRAVFIYDQHDVFQIDPEGRIPPINITNAYGKKHGLVFHLALNKVTGDISHAKYLLLTAFNRINKNDGFYRTMIDKGADPVKLIMGPYVFVGSPESDYVNITPVIKSLDSEVYIVRRMSVKEFPNYFVTKDFVQLAPITDLHPEKDYNWITSELVTWKNFENKNCQGILYKPENFDPKKKYPIIFNYYERCTDRLNAFITPQWSGAEINIPYYVSNGYLVFTPDIKFTIGYPGRSAYNTVVSAALFLSKKSWIDSTKMGLQGHSFGGFETNYIVTHSRIFAAAVSAAGMSDFISIYGSIVGDGTSRQRQYELYRDRIGATLWERKDLYIENSPVLRSDQVSTPILLIANKSDEDVPYQQGIEFFTALRRLKKSAWMLQYDGQGHGIDDEKAATDYTIRMKQFFDHYLKNFPEPIWMKFGIPANKKGIYLGYEFEQNSSLEDRISFPR